MRGTGRFYQTNRGVLTVAEVSGLPVSRDRCDSGFFAFHIHSGGACTGSESDPFRDALGHYNPKYCPHPSHAGDLPPLLSNNGCACQAFLTDRYPVREIIGKTVVIHAEPDDFTFQPAGNSGRRIACGVIRKTRR